MAQVTPFIRTALSSVVLRRSRVGRAPFSAPVIKSIITPIPREPCYQVTGEDTENWGSCHHTPKKSSFAFEGDCRTKHLLAGKCFRSVCAGSFFLLNDRKPAQVLDPPQDSADTLGLGQRPQRLRELWGRRMRCEGVRPALLALEGHFPATCLKLQSK